VIGFVKAHEFNILLGAFLFPYRIEFRCVSPENPDEIPALNAQMPGWTLGRVKSERKTAFFWRGTKMKKRGVLRHHGKHAA